MTAHLIILLVIGKASVQIDKGLNATHVLIVCMLSKLQLTPLQPAPTTTCLCSMPLQHSTENSTIHCAPILESVVSRPLATAAMQAFALLHSPRFGLAKMFHE